MALDDLLTLELGAVAAQNAKNEPDLALRAMQGFYESAQKFLAGTIYAEDPIFYENLEKQFQDAQVGIKQGLGISSAGIVNAIATYSGKYQEKFTTAKISELTKYLTEGFDIPSETRIAIEKYKDFTIADLGKKVKETKDMPKEEKEELGKLMQTFELLKERRLRAKSVGLYNSFVKQNLEAMYSKKEEKQEDKK